MVQYAQIRLQGGRGEDRAVQALPVPDRLTWVSEEVPQGPPFNVAQMYHRLGEAIRATREAYHRRQRPSTRADFRCRMNSEHTAPDFPGRSFTPVGKPGNPPLRRRAEHSCSLQWRSR